jgi:hypothetical protein
MVNIESLIYTPVRKRANKIQGGIESILSEKFERETEEKENLLLERDLSLGVSMVSSRSRDEVNKVMRENLNREHDEKLDNLLLGESFSNIVYNSLPLDESFKEKHKAKITEKASQLIVELKESGLLTEGNHIWKNYFGDVLQSKETLKESADDLITIEKVFNETEKQVEPLVKGISSIVEGKIMDTIAKEKVIAENKVELMNENRRFNGNTLFNTINVRNYKNANDTFVDADKKDVLELALAETIIDFTILESLNTLKLIDFKPESVMNRVKHL